MTESGFPWTENSELPFFPAGMVDAFLAGWFAAHLRAMSEPRLQLMDAGITTYRFLWLRTFDEPICIRAQKQSERSLLHTKQCAGEAGFETGELIENSVRDLSDAEWLGIVAAIDETHFWEMSSEKLDSEGLDGAEWVVEGIANGRYHVVHRWTDDALVSLAKVGLLMIKLSRIRVNGDDVY